MNQIWGDFHRRIAEDRFRGYWGGLKDFIANHHKITERPEDELVAFDAYFVSETIPPPGELKLPPIKRKLFSQGNVPSGAPSVPSTGAPGPGLFHPPRK